MQPQGLVDKLWLHEAKKINGLGMSVECKSNQNIRMTLQKNVL